MKLRLAITGLLLAAGISPAVTLRPSTTVYGIIRDSYGIRLPPDSAMVGAFLGSNEVARTTIRTLPVDANYRFEVNVADPLTAGTNNVVPGSAVDIRVRMGSVTQDSIGTHTLIARGDGAAVRIDLVLGQDTDGDGLPDDWERLAILNSGGRVTSLSQVGPGHDLDGDGIPDDREFWLGTFPFLPNDLLKIENLVRYANGRASFSFMPIENQNYLVEFTPSLEDAVWTTCPISLSQDGALVAGSVKGGTERITLYMDASGTRRFWRLKQQ